MGDADAGARDGCVAPRAKEKSGHWCRAAFPSRKNPSRPITSHLAGYWLKRAFEIGTLPKPAGTLWHGFRRKRATDRRHFPLKDVATAGGWRDVQTMITSISSPDSETMRAVVDLAKPPDPRERLLGPRSVTDRVTDTALDKKRNAMRA